MLTALTQLSYPMRANFLGGQNKRLIRTGDANPPQILKPCDAERRFVPKIELLACNEYLFVFSLLRKLSYFQLLLLKATKTECSRRLFVLGFQVGSDAIINWVRIVWLIEKFSFKARDNLDLKG